MSIAKINLTGTHIQHGFLKVRVDIYPAPTDKTFSLHYIDKPIIPPEGYPSEMDDEGSPIDEAAYNAWIESLPTYKELNPCLCHFIKIDATTTRSNLEAEIRGAFDKATLKQLDDALSDMSKPENRKAVQQLMKSRTGKGRILSGAFNAERVVKIINNRFKGLEVEVGCN